MNSEKINDWLQVVGLFGVVASLLFVGLQMKQDQEIAMSDAAQARAELTVHYLLEVAGNPYTISAIAKRMSDGSEPLTSEEQASSIYQSVALIFLYENIHDQYERGFISEERWQGTLGNMRDSLQVNGRTPIRSRYEATRGNWRESFQRVVDQLIADIDAAGSSQ